MKNIILLISLLSLNLFHDVKLAIFEIYEQGEQLNLSVRIDREDLEKALGAPLLKISGDGSNNEILQNLLQDYINENLEWTFDGKAVNTKISDITFSNELYVNIEAVLLEKKYKNIKEIKVRNTCLLKEIEGHSNLIKSHLYGKLRGFRLHIDRTSAVIDYSDFIDN